MSASQAPTDTLPHTLATAPLPARVRRVLQQLLRVASDEMETRLGAMLVEVEQQLFRLADHARNPSMESGYMQTLRTLRMNRADLIPRFMLGLEASLASLGGTAQPRVVAPAPGGAATALSLVEETEVDETLLLREIAQRHESRASLALHLLGQRFGVLAAAPAFDAERIPLGPRSLCALLHDASRALQLSPEASLLLFRTFERKVMADYEQMAEVFNVTAAAEGVLPSLTYVPLRLRPTPVAKDTEATAKTARDGAGAPAHAATAAADADTPYTAWTPRTAQDDGAGEHAAFDVLQQLLASRRELLGKFKAQPASPPRNAMATADLVAALNRLDMRAASPTGTPRTLGDIKQAVLAQTRQQRGHHAALSREDNDTFELLDMLYTQIERDVQPDTMAASLLRRLQLPLLQAILLDRSFFVRPHHPARELVNTVAESGARWLAQGDVDPALLAPLQRAVDHVVEHAHDDPAAFETGNRALQGELQVIARKAEMSERRHVEAARGKEKLEIAKQQAAEAIAATVGPQQPPRFVRALLDQAWADVLTLTLLREGADSAEWTRQLDTTRQVVETCCRGEAAADPALARNIEDALGKVGYHADEAQAIARRLTSAQEDGDAASRTELAMKLKARARLGGQGKDARKLDLPPRTADEQAQYDRIKALPYGTWFEFTVNQQGDALRKRLSWYSPVTDNALFVNQRGQRVGEQTLDSLARMLSRGQARVVTVERARLVDRAWQATLGALRSFAGNRESNEPWKAPA